MRFAYVALCLIFSIGLLSGTATAATCSCAGVPLLSSMDTSTTEPGDLFLNLTTEFHEISDLVQGRSEINDETQRERSSISQVISASYGIADRWALSGLLSYVEHQRLIGSSFLGEQNTSGMGDAVLMVRYTPLLISPFSRHELALGLGSRFDIGKDDAGGAIAFSEDMQPSTGAPGALLWSSYNYAFNQAATLLFNASGSYINNYEENRRSYTFGDEITASLGFSHSPNPKFSYSAALRYRHTDPDNRFEFDIPNTGGDWVDFVPALRYSFNNDISASLSGRVPVARDLNGALQFSTSYSYALSLTYKL